MRTSLSERKERRGLIAFGASVFVFSHRGVLRFVPRFDDPLSAHPEYLHAIADRMAPVPSRQYEPELPVLVRQHQDFDCETGQWT